MIYLARGTTFVWNKVIPSSLTPLTWQLFTTNPQECLSICNHRHLSTNDVFSVFMNSNLLLSFNGIAISLVQPY